MEVLFIIAGAVWLWRKTQDHYSPKQPLYRGNIRQKNRAQSFLESERWEYGRSVFNDNEMGWHPVRWSLNKGSRKK